MTTTVPADDAHAHDVVRALDEGALAVLPIGGRYALAADALDDDAIARAYAATRRPPDVPMSVAVAHLEDARHVAHVTPIARRLGALLPGALTLALRASATAPDALTAGTGKVHVRVPPEALARKVAAEHGPILAARAAVHGRDPPRDLREVVVAFGERVAVYADGGSLAGARATWVDASGDEARVLREGDVAVEDVARAARGERVRV